MRGKDLLCLIPLLGQRYLANREFMLYGRFAHITGFFLSMRSICIIAVMDKLILHNLEMGLFYSFLFLLSLVNYYRLSYLIEIESESAYNEFMRNKRNGKI